VLILFFLLLNIYISTLDLKLQNEVVAYHATTKKNWMEFSKFEVLHEQDGVTFKEHQGSSQTRYLKTTITVRKLVLFDVI